MDHGLRRMWTCYFRCHRMSQVREVFGEGPWLSPEEKQLIRIPCTAPVSCLTLRSLWRSVVFRGWSRGPVANHAARNLAPSGVSGTNSGTEWTKPCSDMSAQVQRTAVAVVVTLRGAVFVCRKVEKDHLFSQTHWVSDVLAPFDTWITRWWLTIRQVANYD